MKLKTIFLMLLLVGSVSANDDSPVDKLMKYAGNIHQFNSIFPQEKVYLQFDNTSYYTGETIWFKAFVVNASSLQRAESKVLYVDLLSPDGVLLKQEKLKIVAGQADGSFPLLDGSTAQARDLRGVLPYPSGFYEVRAYTNYMQNFNEDIIFSRVFAVYDKPKEEGHYYDESPIITIRNTGMQQIRPETPTPKNINASFFPEGGHLIIGQPCRVAFKVTSENGLGAQATGNLVGTDLTFQTEHDGMGFFEFTPQSRSSVVKFEMGSSSRTFHLPDAETSGCVIRTDQTGDSVIVTVRATGQFKDSELGLTLTCRGELADFCSIKTNSDVTTHIFDLSSQSEGVFRITLFTEQGEILACRSIYHSRKNSFTPLLTVQPDKNYYSPFGKVTLSFSLTDGNGTPFRDRFCVSVRDNRGQANIFRDDIRTSLLLSSDLKGYIENPTYYFNQENSDRFRFLDLLCMVQGWERYDWLTMTGNNEFKEVHRLENSLTVNGWVLKPSGREPLAGVTVNAALIPLDKTLTETYIYKTDQSGYFGFDIGAEFYDKARFTINAIPEKDRLIGTPARIMFERSLAPSVRPYQPGETVFQNISTLNTELKKTSDSNGNKQEDLPTIINIQTGYVLPDVEINEHRKYVDYYTFNAFDVVKDVEIDLDKGEYTTDVLGYLLEKGFQILSTISSDGSDSIESINGFEPFFYVHNNTKYKYNGVFEFPPKIDTKDIRSIMVYDRPLYKKEAWMLAPLFMDHMSHSITNLEGRPDQYNRVIMVDILVKEDHELSTRQDLYKINRRITTASGYSRPYKFYSPEYPNGPIPGDVDNRRTLFWEPNVVTDSQGKAKIEFYNNSITKKFHIEASGITASGEPYSLDEDL